ncbi:bifunctional oligoribonuclease/PAP phosphatase NrnA [Spiroplasma endosymbiont of Aspidapion aeneum]|uniref:DHH family phosphoesterase n=1 Tax=Spiroplasma endosymbiont of Aspidapion aeneum TaxID=3066276 RepID=UPI00313D1723
MKTNDLLDVLIKKYNNIVIAKHVSPDWDAFGSAYGLKEIIIDNYKNKKVYVVGEQCDGIVSDFKISDISEFLLITVDLANIGRIDFPHYRDAKSIFKIDHHQEDDNFAGDNKLVDHTAIACTQVITLWAKKNNFTISTKAAYYLYKGLITDSGRFLFKNVNEDTFEVAKILIGTGIKINEIYDELYLQRLNVVKFKQKMFSKSKYFMDNKIAYIILRKKNFKGLTEERAKTCLNTLSSIKEIKVWFIVHVKENKIIKVSIRSRDYNVNKIATKWNGGGHILASGFEIKALSEIKIILSEIRKLLSEGV